MVDALKEDRQKKAERGKMAWDSGIATLDESRAMFDLGPAEGGVGKTRVFDFRQTRPQTGPRLRQAEPRLLPMSWTDYYG